MHKTSSRLFLLRIITREIGVIKRIVRRRYCMIFKPDYVKEQMKRRKGVYANHGCCVLSIFSRIYNLRYRKCLSDKNYKVCARWEDLPIECQIYPLDEKDKVPETKSYYNFYWEE